MEQPLYRLLELTALENGLMDMLQSHSTQVLAVLAAVGLLTCFIGFYMYRVLNGGLVFILIALAGRLWLEPMWGPRAAVTFIAVIGVTAAFLAYRWYRAGSVALCAAIAASWVWWAAGTGELQSTWQIILTAAAAVAAGVLTFQFPLWCVSGFTAVWGAITFSQLGSYLLPFLPQEGSLLTAVPAVLLAAGGAAAQYFIFRNQKVFPKIMPDKLQHRLEERKKGAAV